ncbi:glutamate-5-semialdehyde dehydrogenase [Candidatus Peregrinibacteria bacterium]|nr:glutamate-5-semialdehyde dehydrogenase [Candidatus Peregrinibacteria bacterium]
MQNIRFLAQRAREISLHLGLLSTAAKNQILEMIAQKLVENIPEIVKENAQDITEGRNKNMSQGLIDRLTLNEDRIRVMASEVRKVATLQDYVGHILESRELKNGLLLKRIRVPIGVIGMIYESRPNVTVDAAVLCLKSGNAVILKGGSDAINSNRILVKIIQSVLDEVGEFSKETRPKDAVQLIDTTDRNATLELLSLHDLIDVIIPRGGKNLIKFVRENSRVPVIETGASVVHTYVHEDANIEKAVKIVMNAKLRRISICNTLDCLLLHKNVAEKFLKTFAKALPKNLYRADHLELRADSSSFEILKRSKPQKGFELKITKSKESDYSTEFLDYILAIKTVRDLNETINHISKHSLRHSEAIITESRSVAEVFLNTVDAACVYWNTSTQFSDGAQFGLGAEIGISTQKLHVRGPFALEGLTSYKWVIEGDGQLRSF